MRAILSTDRLLLRKLEESDRPRIAAILEDKETMYAYEHAFSPAETDEWLNRQLSRYERDGVGLWAACDLATGELIGQCGITMQDAGPDGLVPEIGYLFRRDVWGKGYATEAARACKRYAFTLLGYPAVYSIVRENNLASQRVAIRNGMLPRGHVVKRYYGMDMPHIVFRADRPL